MGERKGRKRDIVQSDRKPAHMTILETVISSVNGIIATADEATARIATITFQRKEFYLMPSQYKCSHLIIS